MQEKMHLSEYKMQNKNGYNRSCCYTRLFVHATGRICRKGVYYDTNSIQIQRKEQEMRQRNEIYGTIRKGDLIPKSD